MGPKPKDKGVEKPPEPVDEVTELEKQVFEIELEDISRRINRIVARQEDLKQKTVELEEKIEECKKENKVVIGEQEQILGMREEEKIQKREENIRLSKEIKIREEKHKKHIEDLEKNFEEMVTNKTKDVAALKEQVRILEDFKQNKDEYMDVLAKHEKHLADAEVEHQRILFNIESKGDIAKARLKKELESRLLNLSVDFQEVYQKQIGDSCHRMTLENKAIESELMMISEELEEYRQNQDMALTYLQFYKGQEASRQLEKDKSLARTILQKIVIDALTKDRMVVMEKLSEYTGLEVENRNYLKKLRAVESDKQRQINRMKEIKKSIEDKIEAAENLKDATALLKKSIRKLQVLIRNGLKIIEEAVVVKLIPPGGMEEEKFLTNEAKIRLFKRRRESVFQRKGRVLQYLLEFLAKAQFTEEELNLLKISSTETINLDDIDFSVIYGKAAATAEKESEQPESMQSPSDILGYRLASDASLPRSVSEVIEQPPEEDWEEEEEEEATGEADETEDVGEDENEDALEMGEESMEDTELEDVFSAESAESGASEA